MVYTPEKIQLINKTAMKQRGWTDSLLTKHFPSVMTDGVAFLYLMPTVIEAEKSSDFLAQVEKRKARADKIAVNKAGKEKIYNEAKALITNWCKSLSHEDISEFMGKEMTYNLIRSFSNKASQEFIKSNEVDTKSLPYAEHGLFSIVEKEMKNRYCKSSNTRQSLDALVSNYLRSDYERGTACILAYALASASFTNPIETLKGVSDDEIQRIIQVAIIHYQDSIRLVA